MAIVTGSIQRALIKYPDLNLGKVKLIGWGAGQFFRDYYPYVADQLPLAYTICPLPENQGKKIHGIEVKSPSSLAGESFTDALIVILANHHSEIMNQISAHHGRFRTIQALTFGESHIELFDELQDLSSIFSTLNVQRALPSPPRTGIFIQGLAFNHTPYVLAWNRMHFPSAYQCMVTWDHQPAELLDRCRTWLDNLILVPQPSNVGHMYRNAVARSARLGVEHLARQNIEFSVRCRSDNILHGSIHAAYQALFSRNRNKGKIAVSLGASWQHVPFHFSEKAMLSRTEDMLALWSQPEDSRLPNYADDVLSHTFELPPDRHFQDLQHYTMESALWKGYAQHLGFPTETLTDSYRFARSRLLALEPHLSWLSLKFTPLFNLSLDTDYSFSPESWNRLFSDSEDAMQRAEAVSRLDMNSHDYWQRKVG